jgi:hypothetical protein
MEDGHIDEWYGGFVFPSGDSAAAGRRLRRSASLLPPSKTHHPRTTTTRTAATTETRRTPPGPYAASSTRPPSLPAELVATRIRASSGAERCAPYAGPCFSGSLCATVRPVDTPSAGSWTSEVVPSIAANARKPRGQRARPRGAGVASDGPRALRPMAGGARASRREHAGAIVPALARKPCTYAWSDTKQSYVFG